MLTCTNLKCSETCEYVTMGKVLHILAESLNKKKAKLKSRLKLKMHKKTMAPHSVELQ